MQNKNKTIFKLYFIDHNSRDIIHDFFHCVKFISFHLTRIQKPHLEQ